MPRFDSHVSRAKRLTDENARSAYDPGPFYFERGMRKSYDRAMGGENGRKQLLV